MVKNPPFNAGDVGSYLGRELRSHMTRGLPVCHNQDPVEPKKKKKRIKKKTPKSLKRHFMVRSKTEYHRKRFLFFRKRS